MYKSFNAYLDINIGATGFIRRHSIKNPVTFYRFYKCLAVIIYSPFRI